MTSYPLSVRGEGSARVDDEGGEEAEAEEVDEDGVGDEVGIPVLVGLFAQRSNPGSCHAPLVPLALPDADLPPVRHGGNIGEDIVDIVVPLMGGEVEDEENEAASLVS